MNTTCRNCRRPAPTVLALMLAALAAPLTAGCGSSTPPVAPVCGVVTIDGQPLAGGAVVFAPLARGADKLVGKSAYGEIQPDGSFTLGTFRADDGAIIGKHRATIVSRSDSDDDPPPGVTQTSQTPVKRTARPPFDMVRVTDRTFDVIADRDNEFTIDLSSDYVRRVARRDD